MTIFTDKVQKYNPRLMKDLGITRVQACGIWGNLGTETGGFTALQEKVPVVKGSRGGYGWMQWTGPRRVKYEAWCKIRNIQPSADESNYQYLVEETKSDEAHSLAQLKKTTTLEAAAETFMKQNLRPGAPHLENRINWAKKAWDATISQAEPAKKIEDIKQKEDTQKTTTAVAGGGIAIALMLFFREHWMAILGSAAVLGFGAWFLIQRYHAHQTDKVIAEAAVETIAPKKAIKKGKSQNG